MALGKAIAGILKWIGIVVGALIVVLLFVAAFFPWNRLRGPAERALSADLQRQVSIGALGAPIYR